MKEIFIDGTATGYFALNDGRITGKRVEYLKQCVGSNGYLIVEINKKTHNTHRLIWTAFNGEIPDDLVIDHINADKTDNRLDNLQLLTVSENSLKSVSDRTSHVGDKHYKAYPLEERRDEIIRLLQEGKSFRHIAEHVGATPVAISRISQGISRKGFIPNELAGPRNTLKYSDEQIRDALNLVQQGISERKAAKLCGMTRAALNWHIRK
jgi:uncharacterized protein YerC